MKGRHRTESLTPRPDLLQTRFVPVCAQCGTENPEVAKFCLACGSPLAAAPPAHEYRKVVTIVFSDLEGLDGHGREARLGVTS